MFDRGHKFQISFSRPEDGVYEFQTHAMRSVSRDSQYFLLLAHAGEIKRTQSREYYRLPVRTGIEFDKFAWNADPEHRYHGGISEPGEKLQGLLINIGGGGVLLRTSGDLRKNDLIAFDIPLPGGDDKLTDVLAKVVEIEQSDSGQHNIHVQFLNLKQSDKDMISKSIQQHKLAPDS
jgi:c-di-GMP-binding flagellar brake protein YcgR